MLILFVFSCLLFCAVFVFVLLEVLGGGMGTVNIFVSVLAVFEIVHRLVYLGTKYTIHRLINASV